MQQVIISFRWISQHSLLRLVIMISNNIKIRVQVSYGFCFKVPRGFFIRTLEMKYLPLFKEYTKTGHLETKYLPLFKEYTTTGYLETKYLPLFKEYTTTGHLETKYLPLFKEYTTTGHS